MKTARLAVAAIAIAAGGGAFFLLNRPAPPPPAPQIVQAAPNIETDNVLVAAREIREGTKLTKDDLASQAWPRASVSPALMMWSDALVTELLQGQGTSARSSFLAGEPIRRDKLIKGASGFMSTTLPSGYRAVAINIDSRGSSSAGNFIQPNDHVDILETYRESDGFATRVLLSNIKVRAIGPNTEEKNGEKIVIGETATLELDPTQAEVITRAQRSGQLSLVLRSMMDVNQTTAAPSDNSTFTVVRYGVAVQAAKK